MYTVYYTGAQIRKTQSIIMSYGLHGSPTQSASRVHTWCIGVLRFNRLRSQHQLDWCCRRRTSQPTTLQGNVLRLCDNLCQIYCSHCESQFSTKSRIVRVARRTHVHIMCTTARCLCTPPNVPENVSPTRCDWQSNTYAYALGSKRKCRRHVLQASQIYDLPFLPRD